LNCKTEYTEQKDFGVKALLLRRFLNPLPLPLGEVASPQGDDGEGVARDGGTNKSSQRSPLSFNKVKSLPFVRGGRDDTLFILRGG